MAKVAQNASHSRFAQLTGEPKTEALSFIFIELGRFRKTTQELENDKEKWYFCLLNMGKFLERPSELQAEVFRRLFDVAEVEALPRKAKRKALRKPGQSLPKGCFPME